MRKILFGVLSLVLFYSATTVAINDKNTILKKNDTTEYYGYKNNIDWLNFTLSPSDNDLSLEELKSILKNKDISTIEKLLKHLREHKPTFMSHYTLGFKSQSLLQESSKEFPRAIVYGETAHFIMTFNGNSTQKGFKNLEITEFNTESKVFEFREVTETTDPKNPLVISDIGAPQPDGTKKCMLCHMGGRPIWEPYHRWPGFYGGDDDKPIRKSGRNFTPFSHSRPAQEQVDWNKWLNSYSKNGRYAYLAPMARSKFYEDPGSLPNADFTFLIRNLNTERIIKILKDAQPSEEIKSLIIFASICKQEIWNPKLKQLYDSFYSKASSTLEKSTVESIKSLMDDQGVKIGDLTDFTPPHLTNQSWTEERTNELLKITKYNLKGVFDRVDSGVAGGLSVIEKHLPQVDINMWSTFLRPGSYFFFDGFRRDDQFINHILIKAFDLSANEQSIIEEESTILNNDPVDVESTRHSNYCKSLIPKLPLEYKNGVPPAARIFSTQQDEDETESADQAEEPEPADSQ